MNPSSERNPCGTIPSLPPPTTAFDSTLRNCSIMEKPQNRRCPEGNLAQRTTPIYPRSSTFPKNKQLNWSSTYRNDFVPRKGDRPAQMRPSNTPWRTEVQFYWDSVYRSEYKAFPLSKKEARPPDWEYFPPCQPMNGQTSYTRDYPKKEGAPAKTTKKRFFLDPCPPPLDDQSTYSIAFVPHGLLPRDAKKTQKELQLEYGSICAPFEGITTYKRDFLPNNRPDPGRSMKPKLYGAKPQGKFDDRTVYRCAYEPFYYDDEQLENCIPYPEYDNMFPPKDKCAEVRCFPEAERTPPLQPPLPPSPPCRPPQPGFVCPSSREVRCGGRAPLTGFRPAPPAPQPICGPCGMR
ncbi:Stabilizer of axonemal microtubules 2 [Folsomia candida]|uniref:Stabilizer of axonemal microtubules 2 n=2 Tax=Folsomia candida TaxID=158441 RepID=A0A226DN64_FOLCA|nr:Stabilizer of axonemal microtubules 2 [Folsomia candida]